MCWLSAFIRAREALIWVESKTALGRTMHGRKNIVTCASVSLFNNLAGFILARYYFYLVARFVASYGCSI
jgi:hypothetical protein